MARLNALLGSLRTSIGGTLGKGGGGGNGSEKERASDGPTAWCACVMAVWGRSARVRASESNFKLLAPCRVGLSRHVWVIQKPRGSGKTECFINSVFHWAQ